jgi:arsenite-transporting ATPase
MERHWESVQEWLGELLAEHGVDRISAEELTVPPGWTSCSQLLQIKHHHVEGRFDAIVVDCAPTGETLAAAVVPGRLPPGGSRRCSRGSAA